MRKKVVVVMPGYNVEKTIGKVVKRIPKDLVSEIILVDDGSRDNTEKVARSLGIRVFSHLNNVGYGGAQKTGYWEALKENPDVVVMTHADGQHDNEYIKALVTPVLEGKYDFMYGTRFKTRRDAIAGGMPHFKYLLNRSISTIENWVLGVHFSEHMSGFRAYNQKVLRTVPFLRLSNNFVFDQEFMISAIAHGLRIGEIAIPTLYPKDASSIRFGKGVEFVFGSFATLLKFILYKTKIYKSSIF